MKQNHRWLDRAIAESETLELKMPWSRATRPQRAGSDDTEDSAGRVA